MRQKTQEMRTSLLRRKRKQNNIAEVLKERDNEQKTLSLFSYLAASFNR